MLEYHTQFEEYNNKFLTLCNSKCWMLRVSTYIKRTLNIFRRNTNNLATLQIKMLRRKNYALNRLRDSGALQGGFPSFQCIKILSYEG